MQWILSLFLMCTGCAQIFCVQVYAEPKFAPTFNLAMKNPAVVEEFIQVFANIPNVTVIEFVDSFMKARKFVHHGPFGSFMEKVRSVPQGDIKVQLPSRKRKFNDQSDLQDSVGGLQDSVEPPAVLEEVEIGAEFLHECSKVFLDLANHFPAQEHNSQLDIVCRISSHTIAMIEVQVFPQDFWDKRAVYRLSEVYFNQLRRGGKYENLRQLISIQIMGKCGETDPWKNHPEENVRRYRYVDTINNRSLNEIELIQVCVPHLKKQSVNGARAGLWKEWVDFFQCAHLKTTEEVSKLSSKNLKEAYRCLLLDGMDPEIKRKYREARLPIEDYQLSMNEAKKDGIKLGLELGKQLGIELGKKQGKKQGSLRVAKNMLSIASDEDIVEVTGLSLAEVASLRTLSRSDAAASQPPGALELRSSVRGGAARVRVLCSSGESVVVSRELAIGGRRRCRRRLHSNKPQ